MKKVFLEISQIPQENNLSQNLFFNKVADHRLATFLKRDSGTGVCLFTEHLWTTFCNVLENRSKQSLSVSQEPMYKLVIF